MRMDLFTQLIRSTTLKTPLQRLNPTGTDVIRKEGYHNVEGDILFSMRGDVIGGSSFIDVNVNEYGMYSALDLKKRQNIYL